MARERSPLSRAPRKKRGRIARRWVFTTDGKAWGFLKVPRTLIREVEKAAAFLGLDFHDTVVTLIRAGLEARGWHGAEGPQDPANTP